MKATTSVLLVAAFGFLALAHSFGAGKPIVRGESLLRQSEAISEYVSSVLGDWKPERVRINPRVFYAKRGSQSALSTEIALRLKDVDPVLVRNFLPRLRATSASVFGAEYLQPLQEKLTQLHGGGDTQEEMVLEVSEIVYNTRGTQALVVISASYDTLVENQGYWAGGGLAVVLFSQFEGQWVYADSVTYVYA